jgi:hypothetical protein
MPAPVTIDPKLKDWATETQARYVDIINERGSMRAAAKALGLSKAAVSNAMDRLRRSASIRGYSPAHDMTKTVPETHVVKGVSSYYGKDGDLRGQWVKSSLDMDMLEEHRKAIFDSLADDLKALSPLTDPPPFTNTDLLVVMPWGDPHFGMYAWAQEAGENFDLAEAKRLTLGAVDRLVSAAPPAETAIILPLGDFFHMDDQTNRTPGHGHQLDADGRFAKVLDVGIQSLRHAILRALEKFAHVIVRIEPGNHDPHAKWALTFAMKGYFENEPRVEIDTSPAKHWFYRFGKVLIGSTHGDTIKQEQMLGVMAADRPEDWGLTKHRYWYSGHIHHSTVKEFPGVTCESFRTLAAKDAYSAGYGYRAGRDMRVIVHHREHGEIERHRCDVGMIT